MAAVDILAAFGYKWAETGTVEALDDAQYKAGWAFIGATPPSVEQFNKVHQIADEKSNYLYAQLNNIFSAAGVIPAAGVPTSLLTALRTAGVLPGRLLGFKRFTASGTYTPTPGTASIIVTVVGGGGAGGGGLATGPSAYSVGSGGAGGSLTRAFFTAGFSGAAIVVGAGGTGVPGGAGNSGGASSFGGTLVTAPGGGGGLAATVASTGTIYSGQGSPGGQGTVTGGGVALLQNNGQPGPCGYAFPVAGPISGHGAPSCLGGGGGTNTNAGVGGTGQSPGAGGGGAACPPSVPDQAGGAGAAGIVIIEEY